MNVVQYHAFLNNVQLILFNRADRFKDSRWYQWLTGAPGQQLGTDSKSLPHKLKPVHVEVGVIAGTNTLEPWFSRLIPGEDGGKVSVERARLTEMADFLVVDSTHTFIMDSPTVVTQVKHFLGSGRFYGDRSSNPATRSD